VSPELLKGALRDGELGAAIRHSAPFRQLYQRLPTEIGRGHDGQTRSGNSIGTQLLHRATILERTRDFLAIAAYGVTLCNSSPGIDMPAEVSGGESGLSLAEQARKIVFAEADCGPHGLEAAGGEAVEAAVLDLGDEAMAAELGDQA